MTKTDCTFYYNHLGGQCAKSASGECRCDTCKDYTPTANYYLRVSLHRLRSILKDIAIAGYIQVQTPDQLLDKIKQHL